MEDGAGWEETGNKDVITISWRGVTSPPKKLRTVHFLMHEYFTPVLQKRSGDLRGELFNFI